MTEHHGPWIATFLDGPLAPDQARHFSVGPIKQELTFAPISLATPNPWVLVGYDTLPVEHPWDGQVTYRLHDILDADEIPDELAELGDPVARYQQVPA